MGNLEHLGLSDSERMVAARLRELTVLSERRGSPCFSHFLDERQQSIARAALSDCGLPVLFWGGHPDAERTLAGVWPAWDVPDTGEFPVEPITILLPKGYRTGHRDVLGTLMSLQIKREAVGDILVGDALAVVFVLESVVLPILQEMRKIGVVGVTCQRGCPEQLPEARRQKQYSGIVTSMRLDCVVAMLADVGRSKAQQMIRGGMVQVNAQVLDNLSREVRARDKISVRGYGKYLIGETGAVTRKGRLHLDYRKYI